LSPHRGDNLRATLGTTPLEDFRTDAVPELPVERGERGVCRDGDLLPGRLDHLPEVEGERRNLGIVRERRRSVPARCRLSHRR
jgi:hypothetical protein